MKKKIIGLLLTGVLALSLAGCGVYEKGDAAAPAAEAVEDAKEAYDDYKESMADKIAELVS